MLLRSSSTPILSSIIKAAGNPQNSWKTSSTSESHHKISFPHDPSLVTLQSKRIRLVNSEDNLIATPPAEEVESENDSPVKFREPTTKTWCNKCKAMTKLERTPSFTLFETHGNEREKGEVKSTDDEGDAKEEDEFSFPLIGDGHHESRIEYNGGFSFFKSHNNFFHEPTTTPMYLALGLGFDMDLATTERRKLYDQQMQRHYEIILRENPCNPLILRNFARYLYKVMKDYTKAEELYTRAILAEPNDGEVQSEYAKLRWEVHGDKERASDYFARSVQASSQNSHVLAAYASFLWGTEETEDEGDTIKHHQPG